MLEEHFPPLNHTIVSIAAVAVAFFVGAFAGVQYEKRQAALKGDNALIAVLQDEIARLADESQAREDASVPTGGPPLPYPVPQPLPRVDVFSHVSFPTEGAKLCRDTYFPLAWKADPSRADQVRITLDAMLPTAPLMDTPVTWNESGAKGEGSGEWHVGFGIIGSSEYPIDDGDLFRIRYQALKRGVVVETQESGPFSIQTCQG